MKRQKSFTHTLSRLLLLAGLFLSFNLPAGIIYVDTNGDNYLTSATNFGKIDTSTGAYTNITFFSGQALGNLAFNPAAGNFYVTEGLTATLRTLTDTGSLSSSIGTIGKDIYGMAYRTSDSTLYAYDFDNDTTGKINPSTGAWTTLNASPGTRISSPIGGRLVLLNGSLYGSIYTVGNTGKFGTYGFDALTNFAQIGSNNDLFKNMVLATDGTTLYGLYADGNPGSQRLYTINPSTGVLTAGASIIGTGLGTYFHGAAIETSQPPPLPEPPSLVLALTGLSAMWATRRRKPRQ